MAYNTYWRDETCLKERILVGEPVGGTSWGIRDKWEDSVKICYGNGILRL
jgi:hypothetical protein